MKNKKHTEATLESEVWLESRVALAVSVGSGLAPQSATLAVVLGKALRLRVLHTPPLHGLHTEIRPSFIHYRQTK